MTFIDMNVKLSVADVWDGQGWVGFRMKESCGSSLSGPRLEDWDDVKRHFHASLDLHLAALKTKLDLESKSGD